jgi:1-deoxy-D-xylulose-5-phosphate reductoisomerase
MGKKITVDSATLMNKGLEAIEARWLFDIPLSKIDLVIHPQSLVHAMVRFNDGALLALLGTADMRLPIEYALLYPERIPLDIPRLDPADLPDLTFERPDIDRFPALRLARLAGEQGGTAPAVLNGANEQAVTLYLDKAISFGQITECVEGALIAHNIVYNPTLDQVLAADSWAREHVRRGTM